MSTHPPTSQDRPAHLTKRTDGLESVWVATEDLTDREFWCRQCRSRVTQSTTRDCQYGHAPDCPHSIRHDQGSTQEGDDGE